MQIHKCRYTNVGIHKCREVGIHNCANTNVDTQMQIYTNVEVGIHNCANSNVDTQIQIHKCRYTKRWIGWNTQMFSSENGKRNSTTNAIA